MVIELAIYILAGLACFGYRTVLSGMKNGCFYFKNAKKKPAMLERQIKNIHFIETPAWYTQSAGIFFLTLAIARAINPAFELVPILISLAAAFLMVTGTYTFPSYWYQRGITGGTVPDSQLDSADQEKSEVCFMIGKRKIQFWKRQLFWNHRRRWAIPIGIVEILLGIACLFFL